MGKRAIIFSQSKKTILQPLRHALFLPPSAQIQSIRAVQEYAQRHFTLTERYQMTLIQTAEGSKYWTLNIWSKSWDILMGSSWAVDGMWTWDMMWTWLMIYFWIYHEKTKTCGSSGFSSLKLWPVTIHGLGTAWAKRNCCNLEICAPQSLQRAGWTGGFPNLSQTPNDG